MPQTPFFIRRIVLSYSHLVPLFIHRRMTFLATCPLGQERHWIHNITEETWKGVWIAPNLKDLKQAEEIAPDQDLIILYIHGGGFVEGYSYMHMETFQAIITQLQKHYNIQASILSLEYSLSPEHKWPKACNEAIECYRYLIHDLGISPSKVILAGDSAGGNIIATALLQLKDLKNNKHNDLPPLPFPAGAALLSPWVDLTATQHPNVPDTLSVELLDFFITRYVTSTNQLQNPLVSPVYGDFSKIHCPFYVAYGSQEILKPSIEAFISNLQKRDKCDVTVLKGKENTTHNWLVSSLMATSKDIYERDCRVFIEWIAVVAATK